MCGWVVKLGVDEDEWCRLWGSVEKGRVLEVSGVGMGEC